MKYVSTTVSYEFYYNSNQNTSSTTTQTIPAELAFSDFANYAIGRLRDGQPVLNRVYTFHLEDDRVSDVTATFSMTYDTLDSGETSYVLTGGAGEHGSRRALPHDAGDAQRCHHQHLCQRPALLQDDHHRRDHFMDRWRHHPSKGGGLMRKLRSRRGETLVETLVSLLIVVLVMAFLATSIVAATRVNAKMRDADVAGALRRHLGAGQPHRVLRTRHQLLHRPRGEIHHRERLLLLHLRRQLTRRRASPEQEVPARETEEESRPDHGGAAVRAGSPAAGRRLHGGGRIAGGPQL